MEPLDRYLRQTARQERDRGVTAVWVLTPQDSATVVGYYTLSALSIERASLPPAVADRLSRYEALPAVLLGRLAVDQRYRGQGMGGVLLVDALERAAASTAQVGAAAVVVDAKDPAADVFYERHGFRPFPDQERRLFMTMEAIKKMLKAVPAP